MPIELSPKKQFLQNKEEADAFSNMISQPVMRKAMTYATAELSHYSVNENELRGAKMFIQIFAALGEFDEPQRLPVKSLQGV